MLKKLKDLYADYRGEEWMDAGMGDDMMAALNCVATEKTIEEIKYNADILQQFHRNEIPDRADDWVMCDAEKMNKVMKDAYQVIQTNRNKEMESALDVLEGDEEESEEDKALAAIDELEGLDSKFYDPQAEEENKKSRDELQEALKAGDLAKLRQLLGK